MSALGGAYGMRQAAAQRPVSIGVGGRRPLPRLPMPAGFSSTSGGPSLNPMAAAAGTQARQAANSSLAQKNMGLFQQAQRNPGIGQAPTTGWRPSYGPGFKGGGPSLPTPPAQFRGGGLQAPAFGRPWQGFKIM